MCYPQSSPRPAPLHTQKKNPPPPHFLMIWHPCFISAWPPTGVFPGRDKVSTSCPSAQLSLHLKRAEHLYNEGNGVSPRLTVMYLLTPNSSSTAPSHLKYLCVFVKVRMRWLTTHRDSPCHRVTRRLKKLICVAFLPTWLLTDLLYFSPGERFTIPITSQATQVT